jgi:hypothetical protein
MRTVLLLNDAKDRIWSRAPSDWSDWTPYGELAKIRELALNMDSSSVVGACSCAKSHDCEQGSGLSVPMIIQLADLNGDANLSFFGRSKGFGSTR